MNKFYTYLILLCVEITLVFAIKSCIILWSLVIKLTANEEKEIIPNIERTAEEIEDELIKLINSQK